MRDQLVPKATLADSGLADEQQEPAGPGECVLEARNELGQLGLAPDERAAGRVGGRLGTGHEVERGILSQDCLLELTQGTAGVDPELLDQHPARLLVDLERLRLTARPIERQHQLAAQALPERVLGNERLELADELGVAAEREVRFDPPLERPEEQLLEACDLPLGELQRELAQRRPAPEGERLPQPARSVGRLAMSCFLAKRLEPVKIELPLADLDHVAGGASDEDVAAQSLAKLRDVDLKRLHRRLRRLFGPQRVDQPVPGDDTVRVQKQNGEQGALLRPA